MGSRQVVSKSANRTAKTKPWEISEGDQIYQELFRILQRDDQYLDANRRATGNRDRTPVGDRIHHLKVRALLHARAWADEAGITFEWTPEPRQDDPDQLYQSWLCQAVLAGEVLTSDASWCFEGSEPPSPDYFDEAAIILSVEGWLSQVLMAALLGGYSSDEQANASFQDGPGGRIVFAD